MEPLIVGISPDGKREGEPFQVSIMTRANLNLLTWAKDGKIAITHYWNTSHLFIANADGNDEVQLTKREWAHWLPKWSPDNKFIAFGASQPQTGNVYVISIQGGEPKNISNALFSRPGVENISDMRWHPNGRSVSCVVDLGNDRGIWNIEIESGSIQKIPLDYAGQITAMDWSPDGKRMALELPFWTVLDRFGLWAVRAKNLGRSRIKKMDVPI